LTVPVKSLDPTTETYTLTGYTYTSNNAKVLKSQKNLLGNFSLISNITQEWSTNFTPKLLQIIHD